MGGVEAFSYFDKLSENLTGQGFTTSGSGPVKALVIREAAIALGMTFHAAQMINDGNNFEILFFKEGAPYTSYSSGVIEGRQQDEDVMKVFDYICKEISPKDKELYVPEPIFKNQKVMMENFPQNIPYGNMEGIDNIELKEYLLDKWNY
jgi:iron(III) transport system substrate-binding protein